MPDQPASQAADEISVTFGSRLERQIALGIRSHGTVVEVGGADTEKIVIDDHDFAVHHHRRGRFRIADQGIKDAKTIDNTGGNERVEETSPAALHRLRFEP
jgi:hypothetical protein